MMVVMMVVVMVVMVRSWRSIDPSPHPHRTHPQVTTNTAIYTCHVHTVHSTSSHEPLHACATIPTPRRAHFNAPHTQLLAHEAQHGDAQAGAVKRCSGGLVLCQLILRGFKGFGWGWGKMGGGWCKVYRRLLCHPPPPPASRSHTQNKCTTKHTYAAFVWSNNNK